MTDHARQLETKIVYWNDLYRKGTPEVSDQVFDSVLEEFEKLVSTEEYIRVRESLFSATGDVRHQYIIGSLKKTKAEDTSVMKWFSKYNVDQIMCVEKIDGMSMVMHYINGKLVKAVSRGDGTYGKDYTESMKVVRGDNLASDYTGQIRTEVLLPKSALNDLNAAGYTYKNPRNATTGIITSKTLDIDALKRCDVIAYQIMGDIRNKGFQYKDLQSMGFNIPKAKMFIDFRKVDVCPDRLKAIYIQWTSESDYQIDGLVIHDLKYGDENVKLPIHTVAFKINNDARCTKVIGIEWTMSRDKKFKPVILLEPIQFPGSIVSRVTGNNIQWIIDRKIEIGKSVIVILSGDIIPKIIEVI